MNRCNRASNQSLEPVRPALYIDGMDAKQELLRHTVAALAYRANRATEGAPAEFAAFDGCGRTPLQILAHMGDLFDWAISIAEGHEHWHASPHLGWDDERARFFRLLGSFDGLLSRVELPGGMAERLFQGPIADALTHTGQIAMLRRLAGCKTKGENYFVAKITAGKTNAEQAAPEKTF